MSLETKTHVVHLTTVHRLGDPRIFYKEIPSLQSAGYKVSLVAQHPRNEVVDGVPVVGLTPISGRFTRILLWKEVMIKIKKTLSGDCTLSRSRINPTSTLDKK